jgi:hypothetical protein
MDRQKLRKVLRRMYGVNQGDAIFDHIELEYSKED